MKKIKVFMFLILTFLVYSKYSHAENSYVMVWENTFIDVEVGDGLYDYINLPKATLYINGLASDHEVVYIRGDASTSEESINTGIIGKYYLAYTAISDIENKVIVTFNVIDSKAPTIRNVSELKFQTNYKPNYDSYFEIVDSYDSKLTITYNDGLVDYTKPGIYKLTVTAKDSSGNTSSEEYEVTILDRVAPTITVLKDLVISYNSTYNVLEYFMAIDNVDGNISESIVSTEVDTMRLGYQNVNIKVTDSDSNETNNNYVFKVVDDEAPVISLVSRHVTLNVSEVMTESYEIWYQYIENVTDNYDTLTIRDIEVDDSSIKYVIGEYNIYYSVTDSSDNKCEVVLSCNVVCDSVPEISVSDVHVGIGKSVNYYKYIYSYDKYDGIITKLAVIDDSNVNYNKEGIYFVNVTIKNSYGKYNYETITVYVEKSFIQSYYYLIFIPIGIIGITTFLIIKRKKSVI